MDMEVYKEEEKMHWNFLAVGMIVVNTYFQKNIEKITTYNPVEM